MKNYSPSSIISIFLVLAFTIIALPAHAVPPHPDWKGDVIFNSKLQQCAYVRFWGGMTCDEVQLENDWEYFRSSETGLMEQVVEAESWCAESGFEILTRPTGFTIENWCSESREDKMPLTIYALSGVLVALIVGVTGIFIWRKDKD